VKDRAPGPKPVEVCRHVFRHATLKTINARVDHIEWIFFEGEKWPRQLVYFTNGSTTFDAAAQWTLAQANALAETGNWTREIFMTVENDRPDASYGTEVW
jgi:hypothetical protein